MTNIEATQRYIQLLEKERHAKQIAHEVINWSAETLNYESSIPSCLSPFVLGNTEVSPLLLNAAYLSITPHPLTETEPEERTEMS